MKHYKITLFGVKETTHLIADYLYQEGITIDLIVSIDKTLIEKHHISDYVDLKDTAKAIEADYYCATDYGLNNLADNFFEKNTFEIGIVYGWQRLIPKNIMDQFSQGVFGSHASPQLLPKGRGRSPLNWGIILGKTTLYNHLFKYLPDADAGDIYAITPFQITPTDTIVTLLYKSLLIAKKDLIQLLHDAKKGVLKLTPQQGRPTYFKKRAPSDGLILFETATTKQIVNLVRGVTSPFPGAFCFTTEGIKIIIWEAWSFDQLLDFSTYQPGDVIDNLYQMPIIKTTDGSLIIRRYEGALLKKNDRLRGDFKPYRSHNSD